MHVRNVDERLLSWDAIHSEWDWKGILVGNGASRAVCDKFKYDSLYDTAVSNNVEHPLTLERV